MGNAWHGIGRKDKVASMTGKGHGITRKRESEQQRIRDGMH